MEYFRTVRTSASALGALRVNHVERFHAVMNFQPVDRLPRIEWAGYWNQTVDRWHAEGLGAELTDAYDIRCHFGLDPYRQRWFVPLGGGCPKPPSHGAGILADMDDYRRLRQYLYPPFDEAVDALAEWGRRRQRGRAVVWITLDGFFWFPRRLLGIQRHLYAFYDQPELLHRINSDLSGYHERLLDRLVQVCRPDFMTFAEDMSYNHGPMLSKGLFDAFLAPYYRRVVPRLREMSTRVLVDSDGDVTAMVPWLEDVGIEGVLPLERQAGVAAAAIRRAHPAFLMIGHFDKMVMNRGEQAVRNEFERLLPLMRGGGFIPSVDHQTPPGVSLEQYRMYLRLLCEYTVRAASGG